MTAVANTAGKALWFIESHFASDITLDDIANTVGVSRFQTSRAFEAAMGLPIMRYVKSRRLSQAARALALGAPDILAVALDAGYGSHEAFTRAFRDHFGVTPEALRARGHMDDIQLMEPIKMDETLVELESPRFENRKSLLVAGLSERYDQASSAGIPAQWQRFMPYFESGIPGQVGRDAYGVTFNFDDNGNFDYLCGVELADFSGLPAALSRLRIGEQRYLVFWHRGHISTIRRTWNSIWNKWLPESGHAAADAPNLEHYGENFDPHAGTGGVELWVPIKA
ncbi:MAG: AraC family transcriptional regulator [Rhodocyclales bacterium]|nr:AraC family transcriptional regulator [Rhodocyclales bacterium]